MYTMETLCKAIGLPEEATVPVLAFTDFPPLYKLRQQPWHVGLEEVEQALGEDPKGFKMLACMLRCALDCWEDHQKLGLSEKIYIDTMSCFTRFVNEHLASFGHYGFDRGFWTVRQVSNKLFRIGELEYELFTEDGKKMISLHIPSDADLSLSKLRDSYVVAKALIEKTFPDFAGVPWFCGSWLLSPNLEALLPEDSKILTFQRSFHIRQADHDGEFKDWVYGRNDIPVDESLPEQTSLQRNMKKFLLSGGVFYAGEGELVAEPFLSAK